MKAVSMGPLFLTNLTINAFLTLESVYQKVNDLEVEMNNLKVTNSKYNNQGYFPYLGP